jgi:hypothetical protein
MFILHPDQYLKPDFKISPFRTSDISFNNILPSDDFIDEYFDKRFGRYNYVYTYNAREAINLALRSYDLRKNDVITILTTSGNFYISSCVTDVVTKFCKWSRKIEGKTKLIFVNHEFGYPFADLSSLKGLNLPIIEDFAHSFFLSEDLPLISSIADYTIFSFPKMFQIQIGGLLVRRKESRIYETSPFNKVTLRYIKNVLSYHIKLKDEIAEDRICNYKFLNLKLSEIGLVERFPLSEGIIPGVDMFKKNDVPIKLPELKEYLSKAVFFMEKNHSLYL